MRDHVGLSKKDALSILDIIESSLRCKDKDDFINLMCRFRDLINLEYMICGHTDINALLTNQKLLYESINISYPEEFLDVYMNHEQYKKDHILNEYYRSFKIQRWREVEKRFDISSWQNVVETSVDFGLVDGYTYGTCDDNHMDGTCFFMAGKKVDDAKRTGYIVEYAVPHLSEVLKRILKLKTKDYYILTKKEIEILNWLKDGKNTWEISVILNKSERVVNFHITNIIQKLNAMNRTHAVVKALQNDIIRV